jgi:putative intracellular protease/amidase
VLLIAREVSLDMELMISQEVMPMVTLLEQAGYSVDVATESGQPIIAGSARLVPNAKLADLRAEDYVGIIIPCMAAGDFADSIPPSAVPLIKNVAKAGKPIAAQNALEMLGAAGLIKFGTKVADAPGVVVTGNMVTSFNCPYMARSNGKGTDTRKLIEAFVKLLQTQ